MEQFEEKDYNIGDNQIRIIRSVHSDGENNCRPLWRRRIGCMALLLFLLLAIGGIIWLFTSHQEEEGQKAPRTFPRRNQSAYVEVQDTMVADISLHRFIPVNATPKLVVGTIKDIPREYVLGAMAADFGTADEHYRVVGAFVLNGEVWSHSRSKYGFCALLKDSLVIGNALTTSYFEQAIQEKGSFFRQYALVDNDTVVALPSIYGKAVRRALCQLHDNRTCIIDTDMAVTLEEFARALCLYDVRKAIALMGGGSAVRWATDGKQRQFVTGANDFDYPNTVNYIVWEDRNQHHE